jgi:hypothetical protein
MRDAILGTLSDADLAYSPGGQNGSLGALIRETAEIEYSYLQSFKTLEQDWSYRHPDAEIECSLARLKTWFQEMDEEMKTIFSAFSDEDFQHSVQRPSGNTLSIALQVEIYIQALFIFFGKAVTYLKAMDKPLPPAVQEYIG